MSSLRLQVRTHLRCERLEVGVPLGKWCAAGIINDFGFYTVFSIVGGLIINFRKLKFRHTPFQRLTGLHARGVIFSQLKVRETKIADKKFQIATCGLYL